MFHTYRQIKTATERALPPRPYFDAEQLRTQAQRPHLTKLLRQLRADAQRQDPLPSLPYRHYRAYHHTGDRQQYETRYFQRRRRLNSAAAIAIIEPSAQTMERLSDILWEICNEYTWALPAHVRFDTTLGKPATQCIDLFAAETAHTMAEIVTVLSGGIDAAVRERVSAAVTERVLAPFGDDPRPRWWETGTNNWAAVCGGAIGMAALALEDDTLRLSALIERIQTTMESFLSGFGDDGGCFEGNDYWIYGYGYYVYFAEALRERTGLDILRGTEAIASFPAAIDFGDGNCVSFSDASAYTVPPTGLMTRVRERLGVDLPQLPRVSEFGDDHCYRWAHLTRTMLWSSEDMIGRPLPRGSAWLPDLEWAVERQTERGKTVAFAAKGGHNDEEHNQLDLGSFILSIGGEQLLCDLGAGLYDADYFGPKRYEALHTSASGHSVPTIGGIDQRPGRQNRAQVTQYRRGETETMLALDLSGAYGGAGFVRTFVWEHAVPRLVLTDSFTGAPAELTERFISRRPPELGAGTVTWRGEYGAVELTHDVAWRREVDAIDTRDHHGKPETVYRLRLLGTSAATHEFVFEIKLASD